jgi:8-oxo-dGTP pyrophosphatase MutT (NUDIX family)
MEVEISYGSIIYNRKDDAIQYLLVQHKSAGHWGFPKGHSLPNENPENTAIREVLEETGFQIILNPKYKDEIQYKLPNGKTKKVIYWLSSIAKLEKQQYDFAEISQVKWFNFQEAFNKLTHEDSKKMLEHANQYIITSETEKITSRG